MSTVPRAKGAPIMQLKDSRETLAVTPRTMTERNSAQLVVCAYVQMCHANDSEAEQIEVAHELLDILGILAR